MYCLVKKCTVLFFVFILINSCSLSAGEGSDNIIARRAGLGLLAAGYGIVYVPKAVGHTYDTARLHPYIATSAFLGTTAIAAKVMYDASSAGVKMAKKILFNDGNTSDLKNNQVAQQAYLCLAWHVRNRVDVRAKVFNDVVNNIVWPESSDTGTKKKFETDEKYEKDIRRWLEIETLQARLKELSAQRENTTVLDILPLMQPFSYFYKQTVNQNLVDKVTRFMAGVEAHGQLVNFWDDLSEQDFSQHQDYLNQKFAAKIADQQRYDRYARHYKKFLEREKLNYDRIVDFLGHQETYEQTYKSLFADQTTWELHRVWLERENRLLVDWVQQNTALFNRQDGTKMSATEIKNIAREMYAKYKLEQTFSHNFTSKKADEYETLAADYEKKSIQAGTEYKVQLKKQQIDDERKDPLYEFYSTYVNETDTGRFVGKVVEWYKKLCTVSYLDRISAQNK